MNLQSNATAGLQQSPNFAQPANSIMEPMEVAQPAVNNDNDQESLSDDDNNILDEEAVLVWRADNVGAGAFGGNIAAVGDFGDSQHHQNQLGLESGQSGAAPAAVMGDGVHSAAVATAPPVVGAAATASAAAAPMEAMGDFIDIDVNGADFDADDVDQNNGDGAIASKPSGNRNKLRNSNAHSNGRLGDNNDEHTDTSDENDNAGDGTGAVGAMGYDRYSADHLPMAMALSAAAAAAAASAAAAAATAAAVAVTASSPTATVQPNTWPDELLNDLSSDASPMPSLHPVHLPPSQPQLGINNLSADSFISACISNEAHHTTAVSAHTTSKLSHQASKKQHVELHRRSHRDDDLDDDSRSKQFWLWTQSEAQYVELQLLGGGGRLGPSSCGPAALLCTLKALGINADPAELSATVPASLRVQNAGLTAYLLSRARAGTTAQQLIDGVHKFTNGRVRGRFFACYPRRRPTGKHGWYRWLANWMSRGAVPIVTLNPQVLGSSAGNLVSSKSGDSGAASSTVLATSSSSNCGRVVADAWHHQMVHGVTTEGAYMSNPLGLVPWPSLCSQLCSESILLVRKADVCKLWNPSEDLAPLASQPDPRWASMNVLGQVVCLLRESQHHEFDGFRPKWAHHIRLPAAYESGISLFATEPGLCKLLANADELPLAADDIDDAEDSDDDDGDVGDVC